MSEFERQGNRLRFSGVPACPCGPLLSVGGTGALFACALLAGSFCADADLRTLVELGVACLFIFVALLLFVPQTVIVDGDRKTVSFFLLRVIPRLRVDNVAGVRVAPDFGHEEEALWLDLASGTKVLVARPEARELDDLRRQIIGLLDLEPEPAASPKPDTPLLRADDDIVALNNALHSPLLAPRRLTDRHVFEVPLKSEAQATGAGDGRAGCLGFLLGISVLATAAGFYGANAMSASSVAFLSSPWFWVPAGLSAFFAWMISRTRQAPPPLRIEVTATLVRIHPTNGPAWETAVSDIEAVETSGSRLEPWVAIRTARDARRIEPIEPETANVLALAIPAAVRDLLTPGGILASASESAPPGTEVPQR